MQICTLRCHAPPVETGSEKKNMKIIQIMIFLNTMQYNANKMESERNKIATDHLFELRQLILGEAV